MLQNVGQKLKISQFRDKGDSARDNQNWALAGFFYSKHLENNPNDGEIWLQRGHSLKELGMLDKAQASYRRAQELNPASSEPFIQLAIISKFRGDFLQASSHFKQAQLLGYQDADFVERELMFLGRIKYGRPKAVSLTQANCRIFLSSCAVAPEELDTHKMKSFLGATNYSYAYALGGYKRSLESLGYTCEMLPNPEYIPHIKQISNANYNIHFGFYPPNGPRYLKGAYNIFCIAWEFERLKTRQETLSYHSFDDPELVLSASDEIWMTSLYGQEAFRRSGLQRLQTVPTPVTTTRQKGRDALPNSDTSYSLALKLDRISWAPLAIWPAMQSSLSQQSASRSKSLLSHLIERDCEKSPIFLVSIFNVHDFRKQIRPLIEAFSYFAKTHPNYFLLLKISAVDATTAEINRILFAAQINEEGNVVGPLVSNNVLLSVDALSRDEMNFLYDISSFYVCTSHAEGQNLPLLEAIGRGVVPISVDHTAMCEYISPETAIVIRSELELMGPRLAARYGMYGMKTYFVDSSAVLEALETAARLNVDGYKRLSDNGLKIMIANYGEDAFEQKLSALFKRLGPTS